MEENRSQKELVRRDCMLLIVGLDHHVSCRHIRRKTRVRMNDDAKEWNMSSCLHVTEGRTLRLENGEKRGLISSCGAEAPGAGQRLFSGEIGHGK